MMRLDDLRKLHQKKYRDQFGSFLVEGEHLVLELERAAGLNPQWAHAEIYVTESYANWTTRFRKMLITERQMSAISDTKSPQGIIACVGKPPLGSPSPAGEKCIYLHEIQDPGNLGTILRTLAWFGGFRCLLSPDSVDPFNPKVVRASMGAIFHVPLELDVPSATLRQRFGSHIACLDMQGASLTEPHFREYDCYLFGNEARGLPAGLTDALGAQNFTIPGRGMIDSLNIGAAVNMCLYELNRTPADLPLS
jgi:RNA methyltransferase, TrmH family